jgi:hypothetical protein
MSLSAGRPWKTLYVTQICLSFLFSSTGNSKDGVTINFLNENPDYKLAQIYVAFCGTTDPSALVGKINNGADLLLGTNYPLADLKPGIQLTKFIGGKFCVALGKPFESLERKDAYNPNFNNATLPNYNLRWDKAEITYSTQDPSSGINLSATDFFSVRLKIETFSQGKMVTTLTWKAPIATIFHEIGLLCDFSKDAVISNSTTGVPTKGPNGSTINVVRIIAPSTVADPANNPYPSFQDYIDHIRANGITTEIQGTFNPVTAYKFTAVIDSAGNLRMNGTITINGMPQAHEIVIRDKDLLKGIYTANPLCEVDGGAPAHVGNDAFGTTVRDVLAGFNIGFIGSDEPNPNDPGKTFGKSPSYLWYTPHLPAKYDFSGAQPDHPFYNQYAAYLVTVTDAYGFPYTDLTQKPFAGLKPGEIDRMDITVLPDK